MHRVPIKNKYQIFTPEQTVDEMLQLLRLPSVLWGKSFLENSCGDGRFLVKFVALYVHSCMAQGYSEEKIVQGLQRDIVGYELDGRKLRSCRNNLDKVVEELGIGCRVAWNLNKEDFLRAELGRKFDYVVGNPPYLSYWDIPLRDRKYIKAHFNVCTRGLWDYCFAFVEKSLSLLNEKNGQLCYIIPSSIFKTQAACLLRKLLVDHLSQVVEYDSGQVFKGVLTSTSVIVYDRKFVKQTVLYRDSRQSVDGQHVEVPRESLNKSKLWHFSCVLDRGGQCRFGDYFIVSSGVATLYNEAFVLKGWQKNGEYLEKIGTAERVEIGSVKKAVTPRSCNSGKTQYIVFPYYFDKGAHKWTHLDERLFQLKFPLAYAHLLQFKDRLLKRDADMTSPWFAYGRSQALSSVQGGKLLISQVVTKTSNVHWLKDGDLPYSGYFVRTKNTLPLCKAAEILSSKRFASYARRMGISVNGSSSRLTISDILEYRW